jgi:hypothetical protein
MGFSKEAKRTHRKKRRLFTACQCFLLRLLSLSVAAWTGKPWVRVLLGIVVSVLASLPQARWGRSKALLAAGILTICHTAMRWVACRNHISFPPRITAGGRWLRATTFVRTRGNVCVYERLACHEGSRAVHSQSTPTAGGFSPRVHARSNQRVCSRSDYC